MRKRIMCLALMLCLMLTACGGSEETPPRSRVSLSADSSGPTEEEILLTIDGREVAAWQYRYWLRRACETVCAQYAAAGVEMDWNAQVEPIGSLAEYVKAQALSDTALYATVENWGETYACTVPPRTGAAAAEKGLTAGQAEELADVGHLYGELYALFCTPGSALAPKEEDVAAFAAEEGLAGAEQIFVPFGADREAARQRAAELFSALNAATDPAAEFAVLAAKNPGPAVAALQLGAGSMEVVLEDALSALKEGQFSGILETADGYSILRRTAPDAETVKEAYFDHLLLEAAADAEICCTEAYQLLDVPAFWQSLQVNYAA